MGNRPRFCSARERVLTFSQSICGMILYGAALKGLETSPIPSVVCDFLKKGNVAEAVRVPGF
jgi:hypothetical protein